MQISFQKSKNSVSMKFLLDIQLLRTLSNWYLGLVVKLLDYQPKHLWINPLSQQNFLNSFKPMLQHCLRLPSTLPMLQHRVSYNTAYDTTQAILQHTLCYNTAYATTLRPGRPDLTTAVEPGTLTANGNQNENHLYHQKFTCILG